MKLFVHNSCALQKKKGATEEAAHVKGSAHKAKKEADSLLAKGVNEIHILIETNLK